MEILSGIYSLNDFGLRAGERFVVKDEEGWGGEEWGRRTEGKEKEVQLREGNEEKPRWRISK